MSRPETIMLLFQFCQFDFGELWLSTLFYHIMYEHEWVCVCVWHTAAVNHWSRASVNAVLCVLFRVRHVHGSNFVYTFFFIKEIKCVCVSACVEVFFISVNVCVYQYFIQIHMCGVTEVFRESGTERRSQSQPSVVMSERMNDEKK